MALLLFSATLLVYRQVSHFDFIEDYDDGAYVTQNFHVKYGIDWSTTKWAFTNYYAGNWDPLTWLSHALDCQLYYLDAGRHHETNVVIHALSAVVLLWLLWQATGFMGRSFAVAALFALHPMNVESVAWIAERKNVLSMLFFLLALGAYRWYALRTAIGRYIVMLLLYAGSLMSKAQIITFPFLLLLWDYWPLGRMFPADEPYPGTRTRKPVPPRSLLKLILEKLPLLAMSAAVAVVTVAANATGGAMSGVRNSYPLGLRLQNAIVSYTRYLSKAFWPSHMAVVYPYPKTSLGPMRVLTALLIVVLVTALTYLARRRARYWLVGWLWFLGALVPMIGIVHAGGIPMADRFSYAPYIGLFIMICWGVSDMLTSPAAPGQTDQPAISRAALVSLSILTFAALCALVAATYRQTGYWRDSLTLWTHVSQVTTNNDYAEDKLGSALVARGMDQAAASHFRAAVAINPSDPLINVHMGFLEQRNGNLRQAIAYYQKGLDATQDDVKNNAGLRVDALKNMAIAYRQLGDFNRAQECYSAAQEIERVYRK